MNLILSNNLSLKHQRFTLSGCKDIKIRKFDFVAKTQFLNLRLPSLKIHVKNVHNYEKLMCKETLF